jgi:hypothetical protein
MPQARINERGYRRYEGERNARGRWWVVARELVRSMRRQRAVILLALAAALPTVIAGVWLYIAGRLKVVDPNEYVYNLYLPTSPLALIMALRAGGGAIADDARAGAFQLYFARPLTHAQYLAGKLVGVGILVAIVSAVPGILLALLQVTLTGTWASLLLVGKAALLGLAVAASLSCVVVALSSLIRRRGLVQAALAAVIFLPWVVGSSFRDFTRTPWPALASLPTHLGALGQWLFNRPNDIGSRAMPPAIAVVMLAAICAGAIWVALRQLRRAEVIAG